MLRCRPRSRIPYCAIQPVTLFTRLLCLEPGANPLEGPCGSVECGGGFVPSAAVERDAGSHALSLTNAHLPAITVYLVNALVPKDNVIKITKQTRDEFQKSYRLEFGITSSSPSR